MVRLPRHLLASRRPAHFWTHAIAPLILSLERQQERRLRWQRFRATCKFLHGGKPASEVAGSGIPGSTHGGSAGLPTPRPASRYNPPPDLDHNMYDSNTGFGLYGTSAFGTREGQMTPLAKVDNVRPLCMDFYKNGFCNRRGPHNQGCLFRHDEIEGQPGKIESADKKDMSREVAVFKAEALYGWNATNAVVKVGFSDMAKAAREWAKKKDAEAARGLRAAAAAAAAAAASRAAAAAAPLLWRCPSWKGGARRRTYYFHVDKEKADQAGRAVGHAGAEGGTGARRQGILFPRRRDGRPTEPADAAVAPAAAGGCASRCASRRR